MSPNPITKTNKDNNEKPQSKGKGVDKRQTQRAPLDDNASRKDDGNTDLDKEGDITMGDASDEGNKNGSKPKDSDSLSEYEEDLNESIMDLDDEDHYIIKSEQELDALLARGKRITKGMLGKGNPIAVSLAYFKQEIARCDDAITEGITTLPMNEIEDLTKEKEDFEKRLAILMKSGDVTASKDVEKVVKKPSLGSVVKNVTAFLASMPPLQIKGDGQPKHKTKLAKYTTISLFYDEFQTYLECHDVPIEDHWETCIKYACAPDRKIWLKQIISANKVTTYAQLKEVLLPFYTSEYEELYHLLHIRYMTQKKLQLDLRNYAIHLWNEQ